MHPDVAQAGAGGAAERGEMPGERGHVECGGGGGGEGEGEWAGDVVDWEGRTRGRTCDWRESG